MPIYRIAGQEISISCPVLELTPFLAEQCSGTGSPPAFPASAEPGSLVCRAAGWVAGANRNVTVFSAPGGFVLDVEQAGSFFISGTGRRIAPLLPTATGGISLGEVLAGPVLVLALALGGIWCLHASAGIHAGKLFLFLGESGQGKSTLAAHLAGRDAWEMVGDDIMPVCLGSNHLEARPHYPQLKIPMEKQPGIKFTESLPVTNLCFLESAPRGAVVTLAPLSPGQTARRLIAGTAGARLFPPGGLAAHLDFCAGAASMVPSHLLTVPRRMEALPEVQSLLEGLC